MDEIAQKIQLEIDNLKNNKFSRKSDKMLMKITKDIKKIFQYSIDGDLIRIFASARQAARELNTYEKRIISAVRLNKTQGLPSLGYIRGYENEPIRIKKNKEVKGRAKTFMVFDSNMSLVNKFDSYNVFCKFLQIKHTRAISTSICSAIRNKSQFRGYWLIYEQDYTEGMNITKNRKQPVKINQLTIDNEFIQQFQSLRELELKLGIERKSLSKKLKSGPCIVNGYKFQTL
jgi:hypothetical protein